MVYYRLLNWVKILVWDKIKRSGQNGQWNTADKGGKGEGNGLWGRKSHCSIRTMYRDVSYVQLTSICYRHRTSRPSLAVARSGLLIWNGLPNGLRTVQSLLIFRLSSIKTILFLTRFRQHFVTGQLPALHIHFIMIYNGITCINVFEITITMWVQQPFTFYHSSYLTKLLIRYL